MQTELCRAIERCRICGSEELRPVISLGDQYIASLFPTGPLPPELDRAFPLAVVRCAGEGGCGLVQLEHTVAPGILYDHYGYRSGTNEIMRANLAGIARAVEELVSPGPDEIVLDIGCNDGTLLSSYSSQGIRRVGIDPSDAVKAIDASDTTVLNDFFSARLFYEQFPDERAKIVTSIAMFYDLDHPQEFVAEVAGILADDGVWVIELSYLPSMLEVTAFDTICHEHLEYYSLKPIEWMLEREGLAVHKAEVNDVNGGSIRLFIRKQDIPLPSGAERDLDAMRRAEEALGLDSDAPYEAFRQACFRVKEQLRRLIEGAVQKDQTVYAYGASTKGNTLLQFCELDRGLIKKAADRNPDKWGTETVGTHIPIVSEEQARSESPDIFLVLPWHFFEGFIKRESAFLEKGGTFIVPLPETKVVDRRDLGN